MDLNACLRDAERHLDAGELAECLAALQRYAMWRSGGGVEPAGGDSLARSLTRRLQVLLREPDDDVDRGPTLLGDVLDELLRERAWQELLREPADE